MRCSLPRLATSHTAHDGAVGHAFVADGVALAFATSPVRIRKAMISTAVGFGVAVQVVGDVTVERGQSAVTGLVERSGVRCEDGLEVGVHCFVGREAHTVGAEVTMGLEYLVPQSQGDGVA